MAETKEPILQVRHLCKSFGPTKALNDVSINVNRGQVTGLIGENGSGKSTMTSIIAGMQKYDSGEIIFQGKPHKPSTMIEGAKLGVGMIVQEIGTVNRISIAQNIFLGEEEQFAKAGFVNRRKMNAAAKQVLDYVGLDVDPGMLIDQLSLQDRKLVEVAKVVSENPELLVVDETTTALSQQGRDVIYDIMNRLKKENKAVIFISHDIQEMMDTCDTLVVLRDGKFIVQLDKEEMDEETIKQNLVGRKMEGDYFRTDQESKASDEVILKADNITAAFGELNYFNMELHKGEVLGIGGLSFCGMHELGKCLYGEMKCITGEVTRPDTKTKIDNTLTAHRQGIGYASKDRDTESLILTATIKDNILAAGFDKVAGKAGIATPVQQKKYVSDQVESLSIKCESMNQNVQFLSGGNKQKVAFAKWIARDCDIFIFDCPTRGVDIGVKAAMYQLIRDMQARGKSIVIISEEMTELLGTCDRILILKDGTNAGEFRRGNPDWNESAIINVMI